MSANQILITQENASGEFAIKTFTPVAGQVMGFDTGLNPVPMEMPTGSPTPIVNTSLTSLTIDCSIADVFRINLTANATVVLSNLLNGKVSEIIIKNTATGIITIILPDNHAYRSKTYTIDAQLARVFSVRLVATKYIWLVSEEISNA